MNPYKHHTLDELLLTPLNEEVFDRILEILEQKQRTDLGSHRETTHFISEKNHSGGRVERGPPCPVKMGAI